MAKQSTDGVTAHDIVPMSMTLAKQPFSHPDWHFEIKWDGFRMLAYLDGCKVELKSRKNSSLNKRFSYISGELENMNLHAVLDGEVVVLKEDGCADFDKLMAGCSDRLVYYVFDLLIHEGESLLDKPLIYRRELLEHLLPQHPSIRFSDHVEGEGEELFKAAEMLGIEGIVAKHKDSRYEPGVRTKLWQKIKVIQIRDAVVAGLLLDRDKPGDHVSSLVVGVQEDQEYKYIGLVQVGLTAKAVKSIMERLKPRATNLFSIDVNVNRRTAFRTPVKKPEVLWCEPIGCRVKYLELDKFGSMRHASFVSLL